MPNRGKVCWCLDFLLVALYQNLYFVTYCQTEKFEDIHKYNIDDGISNRVSNQCCDKSLTVLNTGKNFV
jgi:hypothetical protein